MSGDWPYSPMSPQAGIPSQAGHVAQSLLFKPQNDVLNTPSEETTDLLAPPFPCEQLESSEEGHRTSSGNSRVTPHTPVLDYGLSVQGETNDTASSVAISVPSGSAGRTDSRGCTRMSIDWNFNPMSSQDTLAPQTVLVPQSSPFAPSLEDVNRTFEFSFDEEKRATTGLLFEYYKQREPSEGDRPTCAGARNDAVRTPVLDCGLSVQGETSDSAASVSIPVPTGNTGSADTRDCTRLETAGGRVPALVNYIVNSNRFKSTTVSSTTSPVASSSTTTSAAGAAAADSKNTIENKNSNSRNPNFNSSNYLSPTAASGSAFPSETTILADKYIVLGPVDASTCQAFSIKNHQPLHIKAVTPRTAREVCAQQAQLGECDGVRAPIEAVVSGCGRRAWLVFPPHCGDLHSYVRLRRRLREAEAQRLFAQVAATVHSCHAAGIVLRDLKLRKFVFTDSNRQRVVLESVEDSVVAGEADLLHDKHGCPAYVAPEILSAAAYSGGHADMWGLGVILYTMLVGRYPFHHPDTPTLFARIRSGKYFIPEWVSSRARHLILSLLRRHPHRRLSARQVLLHPWLNRSPRDHVGKDPHDHIVPGAEAMTQHTLSPGKTRAP